MSWNGQTSLRRLGILGGTFDPPQLGHLILAEYTRDELELEHVLFVPVGDHPQKSLTRLPLQHRLQMLNLAIANNPSFSISHVDIDRPGPHYSADTVRIIQDAHPEAQLYFLMGGDNLRDLPTWHHAQTLYRNSRLAVMKRADEDISPNMHDDVFPDLAAHVDLIDVPMLSVWVSSTMISKRLRDGKSVRYLVPDAVLEYIHEHSLYSVQKADHEAIDS